MKDLFDKLLASKLVRFGAVGGAGMFVNLAALAVAKEVLGLHDLLAWFFGFFVSVTFTWWGNRTFTFHEHKSSGHVGILAEWFRFFLTNSFGAGANVSVYALLLWWAPWPLALLRADLRAYPALCVGVLVGLVFNYTLSKKLVFRAKRVTPPAQP
ncbi:GtrA family protein [Rhizomicrobium electricum]|uniref:GtrA/DPMS transmembrane domain-containing protein n=1 Tax=Rhizomicrobium electricum TaxID=480070 RepID=A0ABN1EYH5_9PROT|nr:dolichol-phosphate mannosyltransferase [Rhizomicrobium electricum]